MVERDGFEPSVPLVHQERADFRYVPFSAQRPDRVQRRQAVAGEEWLPGTKTSNVCVCPDKGVGRHEAQGVRSRSSLANEFAGLHGLDGKTLKECWRALYGIEPPV